VNFLASLFADLILSQAWEAVRDRLKRPDPTWAQIVELGLAKKLERDITVRERNAITAWLARADVFQALVESSVETVESDSDRVVEPLLFELGDTTVGGKTFAHEVVFCAIVSLVEIVDRNAAVALIGSRMTRLTLNELLKGQNDLKEGQRVIYDEVRSLSVGAHPILLSAAEEDVPFLVEVRGGDPGVYATC
jgi:hypothetical protein